MTIVTIVTIVLQPETRLSPQIFTTHYRTSWPQSCNSETRLSLEIFTVHCRTSWPQSCNSEKGLLLDIFTAHCETSWPQSCSSEIGQCYRSSMPTQQCFCMPRESFLWTIVALGWICTDCLPAGSVQPAPLDEVKHKAVQGKPWPTLLLTNKDFLDRTRPGVARRSQILSGAKTLKEFFELF